jgi:hypothetical protein
VVAKQIAPMERLTTEKAELSLGGARLKPSTSSTQASPAIANGTQARRWKMVVPMARKYSSQTV